MTHEGCHWLIHRKAFAESNPFCPAGIYENQFLAAKRCSGGEPNKESPRLGWRFFVNSKKNMQEYANPFIFQAIY